VGCSAYSRHSIHPTGRGGESIMGNMGVGTQVQGNGSTTEQGGIMEVAMLGFDLDWA
jgi:hypothetical protein